MEFIIKTDLGTLPAKIDFNFEQIKAELETNLESYQSLVVTPDTIRDGKAKRAALNKLKDAINAQRIRVKKQVMAPYEGFEQKVKVLVGLIDEAVGHIDGQVKQFDDQRRAEKKAEIVEIFAEQDFSLLPLERIWDDRWLNATFKVEDAEKQIKETIDKIDKEIEVIKAMKSPHELAMTDAYLKTLNIGEALAIKARLEALKEPEVIEPEVIEDESVNPEPIKEELRTLKVIFHDTTAAFRAEMKVLTTKHKIKYGGLE